MFVRININLIQISSFALAKKTMNWDEPIPDFNTRYPNILESCLAVPFQRSN